MAHGSLCSVPLQLCLFTAYFPSRKKTWLPESRMAQPRRMPQTPLGRADCHREYLACSFFKKHWVSIFSLTFLHNILVPESPQGSPLCQQLSQESPFWSCGQQRMAVLVTAHRWTQHYQITVRCSECASCLGSVTYSPVVWFELNSPCPSLCEFERQSPMDIMRL